MLLIFDTANKLGVNVATVFDLASAFQDKGIAFNSERAFEIWERDRRILPWVENFCLDVMADRIDILLPAKHARESCLFED